MNKRYTIRYAVLVFTLFIFTTCESNQKNIPSESTTSVIGLLTRIAKNHVDKFSFELLNSKDDVFELASKDDKIVIKGNNSNSMAKGLNYYLKNYCHTYVSWFANDRINLPDKLPSIPEKIVKKARVKNRFFLNYCTFGYTMPWWKWKDWERFIDWMALNGINMPLAITGQEAIWYEVWKEFGLSDTQIRSYFTGPAHLPWHRMSNLDKWGGPLPMSWLENQKDLQKKIVKRERELGMTPVLPAFAGHVPEALKSIKPNAKIDRLSSWGGFSDEYRSFFLDPLDPLFKEVQFKFLEKQSAIFGTNHIYGADPFNEVDPPSWEPEYLDRVSKSIFESIQDYDVNATWLQMTWIFYFEREKWTNERVKAMVRAVPQDKMILLDYYCENKEVWKMTDSYFGQPFIWCYLGNFGGNTMLAGNIDTVESRIENALKNNKNMWGIGSTLEALDVNPVMYEYVFDKVWTNGGTNTKKWISKWADVRFGSENENFRKAWELLHSVVYKHPARLGQATLTNARPTLTGSGNWTTDPTIDYDNSDLYKVWTLMIDNPSEIQAYQYDITNVGRQYLGNYFLKLRDEFSNNYKLKNIQEMKKNRIKMLELLDDMDRLLSTNSSFLLGKWVNDASFFAKNGEEKKYYMNNAKNIITTWGTKSQSLNDYGNRAWAGLMKSYYKKRWEMFLDDVILAVEKAMPFDEKEFHNKVTKFEWEWTQSHVKYKSTPEGNPLDIAKILANKYINE